MKFVTAWHVRVSRGGQRCTLRASSRQVTTSSRGAEKKEIMRGLRHLVEGVCCASAHNLLNTHCRVTLLEPPFGSNGYQVPQKVVRGRY